MFQIAICIVSIPLKGILPASSHFLLKSDKRCFCEACLSVAFGRTMWDSLRRFSPAYCDLPTMISNIAALLRMSLVNIERKHTKRIPVIFYVIQILCGACYFYGFPISMMWFVFVRWRETKDNVAASVVFSLSASSITGISKLFYICYHIETVKNLIDEYLDCDAALESGTRFHRNLFQALHVVKRRAVGFWIFLNINGLIYIVVALVRPGRHFVDDLIVIYGLEPMFETPNYEIAFATMTAGIIYGIPAETNTTALLTVLTGYVESQMLALSKELDNLWDDANTNYQLTDRNSDVKDFNNPNMTPNERARKLLRGIAMTHSKSITLYSKVEKIFRKAMVIVFGFIPLALIAELLGGLENTYLQLPFTLIQVAIVCFIGQRLIDASLVLSNSVYSCKWERLDKLNQRTVYLMFMNSQRTLMLSVGGLTVLSFSYFMSILKSIYSAYTTLRSRM